MLLRSGLIAKRKVGEEGMEKGIGAPGVWGLQFLVNSVCAAPFPVVMGKDPPAPPRGGLGFIRRIVPLGVTWWKGQYFGDSAGVFLETKTFLT